MSIGKAIRDARKRAGLTQKELGAKLHVTASMIAQYENGTRVPKISTLKKIADALNLPPVFDQENTLLDKVFETFASNDSLLHSIHEDEFKLQSIKDSLQKFELNYNNNIMESLFNQLNSEGQEKAIEQVELLTKIPEYQKDYPNN